jgi:hypothetical protein
MFWIVGNVPVVRLTGRIVDRRDGVCSGIGRTRQASGNAGLNRESEICRVRKRAADAGAIIVEFPVGAFGAAEKRTGALEPAATLNGLSGFEVTPTGNPETVTCTEPAKPLSGLTESITAELVDPWWRLTEFEENAREKSGCGGGGGVAV